MGRGLVSVLQLPEAIVIGRPSEPVCAACGSKNGEAINARALEEAVDGRYEVVIEILNRTKPKPPK
jgi:hypothetical protein